MEKQDKGIVLLTILSILTGIFINKVSFPVIMSLLFVIFAAIALILIVKKITKW